MVILTATCHNGEIKLMEPLPPELEGKQIQLQIEELQAPSSKHRQAGSAAGKVWMSPDFDEPLSDFQDYMP